MFALTAVLPCEPRKRERLGARNPYCDANMRSIDNSRHDVRLFTYVSRFIGCAREQACVGERRAHYVVAQHVYRLKNVRSGRHVRNIDRIEYFEISHLFLLMRAHFLAFRVGEAQLGQLGDMPYVRRRDRVFHCGSPDVFIAVLIYHTACLMSIKNPPRSSFHTAFEACGNLIIFTLFGVTLDFVG